MHAICEAHNFGTPLHPSSPHHSTSGRVWLCLASTTGAHHYTQVYFRVTSITNSLTSAFPRCRCQPAPSQAAAWQPAPCCSGSSSSSAALSARASSVWACPKSLSLQALLHSFLVPASFQSLARAWEKQSGASRLQRRSSKLSWRQQQRERTRREQQQPSQQRSRKRRRRRQRASKGWRDSVVRGM